VLCRPGDNAIVEPYYQDDWATLYHGDCRDVLPTLGQFDLCLTDPPFGIGTEYDEYEDTEDGLLEIIDTAMPIILKKCSATLLTPGQNNEYIYPRPKCKLIIVYKVLMGAPRHYWGFQDWTPIFAYGKDPYYVNGMGGRSQVLYMTPEGPASNGHPCPKPMNVWKKVLLRGSPLETDTILDPFAGAGTTLRAAKDMARKSVGIELSEAYCEVIAKNLSQEILDFGRAA